MYALKDEQIDFILNDIKIRGVEMEDLQLNLLDHICCIIEYELEPNGDFKNFYHKIIPRFFKKELKEIQEETNLLLTFKHYYAMKKTMNTVGIIASIGIVLGAIFRFQHWPGANVMLVLGVVLISFVFLPIMFTLKLRESTEKRDKVVLILGCLISILFIIATTFRLMHWPWANILLGVSVLVLLFLFVPVYLFTGLRNPITKVNTLVNGILIIAGSGLLMSLSTNRNMSKGTLMGIINVYEHLSENVKNVNASNALIYQSIQANSLPEDAKAYLQESNNTLSYLEDLKTNFIATADRIPVETAKNLSADKIINMDNEIAAADFMLGIDHQGKTGYLTELQGKLSMLSNSIAKLKDVQKGKWNINVSVEKKNFEAVTVAFVLQEFAEMEYEIAITNSQILNYYSAKM